MIFSLPLIASILLSLSILSTSFRFTAPKLQPSRSYSTRVAMTIKSDDIVRTESLATVDETWKQLEDFGATLTRYSKTSLFLRALSAGIFVGLGGVLTASVGYDMAKPVWAAGAGLERFLSGAVGFPISIIMISLTGNGAWTGDMLLVARAYIMKRSSLRASLRMAIITWLGCLLGTVIVAAIAVGANVAACTPILAIAANRLALTNLQIFLRGILGGLFICLAIFLQKMNRDMVGKVLAIWFPISTYVICGYEHALASMFFLSCAKINGASITFLQILKFLIPSTLGNLVGGGLLVGLGLGSIPGAIRERRSIGEF